MPKKIIKYRCDFCLAGGYDTAEKASEHEANCIMNPEAHGCKTCSNFLKPVGWYDRQNRLTGTSERCKAGVPLHNGFKTQCPTWEIEQPENATA